ncbi:ankyrin repeat-containing domain protein [Talaromyces proteolyticus]|uniref:Ankyrin repeat-containing domain protein n=1 Tax=Talaromyces proteolyticus TaxID=1131652 RepID=A0AAD4Q1A3_9EURO|nr:ankyrin repeat-containing domain protein [Talaromyces proteolyticus]KAH8698504.1 ankyrin repeat-containing domain protein [Talaromyces proteolyticus]
MDGLSAAASVIAVIQITGTVVSLCSDYLKAVKNAKHDIERLQGELIDLSTTLQGAQKLLDSPRASKLETSQGFRGALNDCSLQLKDLEAKLKGKLEAVQIIRSFKIRSLKWPLESKDVQNIIEIIRKSKHTFVSALNIDQTTLLLDNLERVEAKEQLEILEWISRVPYGKHHNVVKEARTASTCDWLLDHERFHEWENSNVSVVLWLQGSPGAGKTFLASKVIDHVQGLLDNSPKKNEGFAFFYCNRNETERREPLSVLQSYARQLSTPSGNLNGVPKRLYSLYWNMKQKGSDLGFKSCKDELLELTNIYESTTLVLDALDECELDSRSQLIETIEFLTTNSKSLIRVFISSRPDRDIKNRFVDKPNIEIQATHNAEDIRKFVNGEIVKHGNWAEMSPALQEDIVEVLLENSDGMFQWVYLQVKQILDLESEEAIRARLGKLPETLKEAYDEIYSKIQVRNEYDKLLADRAIMWVMCAFAPLNSEQLLAAIRLDFNDITCLASEINESQLLHICNHLLILDSQRGIWRFSHLSVREYFQKKHWTIEQAHCHTAKVCLALLIETYKELRTSEKPDNSRNQDVFNPGHQLHKEYCGGYWMEHVQTQENLEKDSVLADLLKSFLGSPIESSAQYRGWHHGVRSRGHIYRYDDSPVSDCARAPNNSGVYAMCCFSFYTILSDWWDDAEIWLPEIKHDSDSLLVLAALSGSLPICEILIKGGFDVNMQHGDYGSALAAAAEIGNTEIVKFLVGKGARIDLLLSTGDYGSALAAAAAMGNTEIVKFLVEKGAHIDLLLSTGRCGSALTVAAAGGDTEIVKFLVEKGAHIDLLLSTGFYGSALAAAAAMGNTEIVKFLIEKGAHIGLLLSTGRCGSALTAAAARIEITDSVKFLVEKGAHIDLLLSTGDYGSALAAAAAMGNTEIVKFLVEKGAHIDLLLSTGDYGSALAAAAAAYGGSIKCVKFLVEQGAEIDLVLQTGDYGSALVAAAYWGSKSCVKCLIDAGANVNLRLKTGLYADALCAAQADLPVDLEADEWDDSIDSDFYMATRRRKDQVIELLRYHGAVDDEETLTD